MGSWFIFDIKINLRNSHCTRSSQRPSSFSWDCLSCALSSRRMQRFCNVHHLVLIWTSTFAWAGYHDDLWHFWWIWDAYWEFSYVSLTLLIAYLWRPNSNNKRYPFSANNLLIAIQSFYVFSLISLHMPIHYKLQMEKAVWMK